MLKKRKRSSRKKSLPRVSLFWRVVIWLRRLLFRQVTFLLMGIAFFCGWFYYSGVFDKTVSSIASIYHSASEHSGLVLTSVYLEGKEHTRMENVNDVLQVNIGEPVFSIDLWELKARVEALDWVEYAVVERVLPSTLSVRIRERRPLALWQHQGRLALLDAGGEVIEEDHIKRFSDLIILVGEDVPLHAGRLFRIFQNTPKLTESVSSATRVSNRRWDVQLYNGINVMLPEEDPDSAWAFLAEKYEDAEYFNPEIRVIDLRLPEKIFIR